MRSASWEQGYGDFTLAPDLDTLRRVPWLTATALVLCDVQWHDGSPSRRLPRQVLKAQMERAAALGLTPMTGSELEFYLFEQTYEEACARRYEDLTPSVPVHPRLPRSRLDLRRGSHSPDPERDARRRDQGRDLQGRGVAGHHKINFRFADALTMADNHVVYKNGAKEIAHANGCSITFMAKPFESWIGNSCHVHASRFQMAAPPAADDRPLRSLPRRQIACFEGARSLSRHDQLVQALRGRERAHDDAGAGEDRQPHVRVSHRRTRGARTRGDPYSGRRRQPVSRLRRDHRGRPAWNRERGRSRPRSRGMPAIGRKTLSRCAPRRRRRTQVGEWHRNPSDTSSTTPELRANRQSLLNKVVTDWERTRYFERGCASETGHRDHDVRPGGELGRMAAAQALIPLDYVDARSSRPGVARC